MSNNITFTKEHKSKLDQLLIAALYDGLRFKGIAGTELNVHQLMHECTIKTIQTLYSNKVKEIETQTKLDKWSMTAYQQEKLESLKVEEEILDLMIGYKKYILSTEARATKLKEKRELLLKLKDESKTPQDRIKELETEILELEN